MQCGIIRSEWNCGMRNAGFIEIGQTRLLSVGARQPAEKMIKRSVHQIIKDMGKPISGPKYDFIYCAGLFDYLTDQVCKRLMNYFYDLLAPGGLLLSTNVSSANPSHNWMEYVLDWHLFYRSAAQFAALAPERAPAGSFAVVAIGDGVNIALEGRKPENGN